MRRLAIAGLALAACGSEPIHLGPCVDPGTAREVLRSPGGIAGLTPAAGGAVFLQSRDAGTPTWSRALRFLSPGGPVDLAPVDPVDDVFALAAGEEVFWSTVSRGADLRRSELRSVPLAGGATRTVALVDAVWGDQFSGTPISVVPFAADERAVYVSASRLGGEVLGDGWIAAVARADGTVTRLAPTRSEATSPQLVGGELWWLEAFDGRAVYHLPVAGPPAVVTVPASNCLSLRVTERDGFFCGGAGRLTRYDRDGQQAEVVIEDASGGIIVPFAAEPGWLWIQDGTGRNVRRLRLSAYRLEDVSCARTPADPPVLGATDLFSVTSEGRGAARTSVLRQQPRP
jgi:hypothetical protein